MTMHRRPLGRGRTMAAIGGVVILVGCVLPWWKLEQPGGGLPPLSGFFAKLLLLQAVPPGAGALPLWSVLLIGGFVSLVALSRAGSTLFWRTGQQVLGSAELDGGRLFATLALLAGSLVLVVFAQPLLDYAQASAAQLHDQNLYRAILQGAGA